MKTAFVFPGQGSQYLGMGQSIYDNFEVARETFDKAAEVTGRDIAKLCFEGSDEELLSTLNQQPTIHTVEIATLRAIEEAGIKPDMAAGFSLGEYGALVAANIIDFEDTVQLVSKRAKFIQDVVAQGVGKMVAILGLDRDKVEEIAKEASKIDTVECSNFNAPGNIVVSGYNDAVDKAVELAMEAGAKKASPLKVSAPFHTTLIKDAGAKMAEELKKVDVRNPEIAYYTNLTGKSVTAEDDQIDILDRHIWNPVRWEETIREMVKDGVELIVEVGPKGGLVENSRRTVRKIKGKKVKFMNVENAEDIQKLKEYIDSQE